MKMTGRSRVGVLSALSVLVGVALLGACRSGGGNPPPAPPPGPTPVVAGSDGPWTPQEAAASIAEAAADAAAEHEGDRAAVIDAATEAAVDHAMLVAPGLGIDSRWADAVRNEIAGGVVTGDASTGGVVVLAEFIRTRVRAKTLEWLGSPR